MHSFRFSSEIFHAHADADADADANADADAVTSKIFDLIRRWKEVGRDVGEG